MSGLAQNVCPRDDIDGFLTFQKRVAGTNINSATLLTTDYLNHFNEIVMIFEMLPVMPEAMEDVREWEPKNYIEHFKDSFFPDKDLAIEAYQYVPTAYRIEIESLIAQMDQLVEYASNRCEAALEAQDLPRLEKVAMSAAGRLRTFIDRTSAVIRGPATNSDQQSVDDIFDD